MTDIDLFEQLPRPIVLGTLVLGEPLQVREIAGAIIIASGLLIIDGRALDWLRGKPADRV